MIVIVKLSEYPNVSSLLYSALHAEMKFLSHFLGITVSLNKVTVLGHWAAGMSNFQNPLN